jgi:hypothetical protein
MHESSMHCSVKTLCVVSQPRALCSFQGRCYTPESWHVGYLPFINEHEAVVLFATNVDPDGQQQSLIEGLNLT